MTKFGDERELEAVFSGGKIVRFFDLLFDEGDLTLNQINASGPYYLLGIWHCIDEESLMYGIIVQPTGASYGQYIRAGYWCVSYYQTTREKEEAWGNPPPSTSEEPPNEIATIQDDFFAMLLPEEAYKTKDENDRVYTITIL